MALNAQRRSEANPPLHTVGVHSPTVGDIVTSSSHGLVRTWVPKVDEDWWIQWWGRQGIPAARWRDYQAWGGRFYNPAPDDRIRRNVMLRPKRHRTNYRAWRRGY